MADYYKTKCEQVIAYVRAHLDEELPLDALAKVAGISPFHFHRIFRTVENETVGELILRMRMETALKMLTTPVMPKTVLEIALEVGFHNPSSFSRAFKRYFGFTPTEALSKHSIHNSKPSTLHSKYGKAIKPIDLYPVDMFNNTGDINMQVNIMNWPEQYTVGLESNYTHHDSMGAWLKLYKWYLENKGTLVDSWKCIGLYLDDPAITPESKCRAKQCVFVNRPVQMQAPFITETIPAGRYAVAHYAVRDEHKGQWGNPDFNPEEFHNFIQSFIKNWLVTSGHIADDYPLLMSYQVQQEAPVKDAKGNAFFQIIGIDLALKLKD